MKAIELIEKSDIFSKLQKLFPEFVESAETITVIPWQEEFQIADKNPEIIDAMDFYAMLYKNKMISQEEYERQINELFAQAKGYISRTEGISFIKEREISFRSPKTKITYVIHEIGHIHYEEPDPVWSATYGGGELLMQLALFQSYTTDDASIRHYHSIIHNASILPENTAKEIAEAIIQKTKLPCYPSLHAISLFSGAIPDGLWEQLRAKKLEEIYDKLNDSRWEEIDITYSQIRMFLTNIVDGLRYRDDFSIAFAKALGLIKECPVCGRLICVCD
jgi:hypothetical protein